MCPNKHGVAIERIFHNGTSSGYNPLVCRFFCFTPMLNKQRKDTELMRFKFNDLGNGSISGYVSVFGNVDSAKEIVAKGSFAQSLEDFQKHGFIAWNHDWHGKPIGYPTRAFEDDYGLFVEIEFHNTPEAQQVRQICKERMLAGKSVRFSIGYEVLNYTDDATTNIRTLTEIKLYEASVVNVPANPLASADSVKAAIQLKKLTNNNYLERFMNKFGKNKFSAKNLFAEITGEGIDYVQQAFDVAATQIETLVADEATDANARLESAKVVLTEFAAALTDALAKTEQSATTTEDVATAAAKSLRSFFGRKNLFATLEGVGIEKLGQAMNVLYTEVERLFNDTQTPVADRITSLQTTLADFMIAAETALKEAFGITDEQAPAEGTDAAQTAAKSKSSGLGKGMTRKQMKSIEQALFHIEAAKDVLELMTNAPTDETTI